MAEKKDTKKPEYTTVGDVVAKKKERFPKKDRTVKGIKPADAKKAKETAAKKEKAE